jgi:Fe-S-cluster-containing hydrogenase component 2
MNADGKAEVNQEYCVGCGICKSKCTMDAIQIKQTQPMLGSVQEYFLVDGQLDLKI